MTAKERLIREIEQTPENLIEELLDFLFFAKNRRNQQANESNLANQLTIESSEHQQQHKSKPIWEIFEEGNQDLPEEVIAKLPKDGAAQIDHYLYGKPKQ